MSVKASIRQLDAVSVVDLSGRIVLGESDALRDTIEALVGNGNRQILLNLSEITYIDSAGIGELVGAFTTVRNQGGELKLLNLTRRVHDLLQITKLYTVFDIRNNEVDAIKSFRTVVPINKSACA